MRVSTLNFNTDNELRAEELRNIGFDKLAKKIEACKPGWICHHRMCPTCGPKAAIRNGQLITKAVHNMQRPHVYLASLRSKHLFDLGDTILYFKHNIAKLRNRKYWKEHVYSGAGALEVKPTTDGRAWNVHSHFILDISDSGFDIKLVNGYWNKYSDGRGTFMSQSNNQVTNNNISALVNYNAKSDTWCPPPGTLDAQKLAVLIPAIKRRQIPIVFPSRQKKKRMQSAKVAKEANIRDPSFSEEFLS